MFVRVLIAAFGLSVSAQVAAACPTSESGAKCIEAPPSSAIPAFRTGDRLPRGAYYMLLNTEYFGMPPAADGWVYFRVEGRILRVRARTLEVLDDVTHLANAAF